MSCCPCLTPSSPVEEPMQLKATSLASRAGQRLRVALVQFHPKLGQIQANMARAKELCRQIPPHSVDLVCLPEMAFSGYGFPNAEAIRPYLEIPKIGPTSLFCAEVARNLGCCVIAGYPEQLSLDEVAGMDARLQDNPPESHVSAPQPIGANSAALFGPAGEWLGGYRKTNLFPVDKTWAKQGTGFATFTIPLRSRVPHQITTARISVGICNDLNPAPTHNRHAAKIPYEIASYALEQKADALILLNAWLESGKYPEEKQDLETIGFWSERLRPLWDVEDPTSSKFAQAQMNALAAGAAPPPPQMQMQMQIPAAGASPQAKEMLVAICNRGGSENETRYAGSSVVFRMRPSAGQEGNLRAVLGREEEGLLIYPPVDEDWSVDKDLESE
ncbi:hypothetical protein MKEN_00942200 [Mycena kentingensis (nom. inval.)]|nr:hypothetical protein MKEN_00942200 [Mycena kentingensis (nom. inval.)]